MNLTKAHMRYSFCVPGTSSWGWRHRTYGTLIIITGLRVTMLLNGKTICCLIRWCGPPKIAFWGKLTFCWTILKITIVFTTSAVDGGISIVVESLTVVGDVKEPVYYSSLLLSSSSAMCSGEEGLVSMEWVSCSDRMA